MLKLSRRPSAKVSWCVAFVVATLLGAVPARPQTMPVVIVSAAGGNDVWLVDEASGSATPWMTGVTMLTVTLTAHPARDRMRIDMPTLQDDGPAQHVRLPQGGALYFMGTANDTQVVLIGSDGLPQVLFTEPLSGGVQTLLDVVAVDPTGAWALVASTALGGGDAWVLDLTAQTPPRLITAGLAPLTIESDSLLVSGVSAWFVADDSLYRADLANGGNAAPVSLPLLPGESLLSELVLAEDGVAVAVLAEGQDATARRLLVVPLAGAPVVVTNVPGAYDLPSYDNELGPWLALSADGMVVAFREIVGTAVELYVDEVALPGPPLHVTTLPDFPAYMDNVGVLGFVSARILDFFAGDQQLSPVSGMEVLGAADLFQADLTTPGTAAITNVSKTSGSPYPPFNGVGTMLFEEALLDPLADRFLLMGDEGGLPVLQTVSVLPYGAHNVVKTPLNPAFQDEPLVRGVGDHVLIHAATDPDEGGLPAPGELHLLGPLVQGASIDVMLATVPAGVTIDRFAADANGDVVAFVASVSQTFELPVLLYPDLSLLALAWPQPFALAPALAFSSSSRLYLGLGAPNTYVFASFGAPGIGIKLPLPIGDGYPLAH